MLVFWNHTPRTMFEGFKRAEMPEGSIKTMTQTSENDIIPQPPASKPCTRCHRTKPLAEFSRDARTKDGRHALCKECRNAHARSHYQHRDRTVRNLRCPDCGKTSDTRYQPTMRAFRCRCGCVFTRKEVEAGVTV